MSKKTIVLQKKSFGEKCLSNSSITKGIKNSKMVRNQFTMHHNVVHQELWWLKSTPTLFLPSLKTINIRCWALNFIQKSQRADMSIFHRSGGTGPRRLSYMKYFNVLQWESRFPFGLNSAKNTDYIKNISNKNCSELNSCKKHHGLISSSPPGVELGSSKELPLNLIEF